MQKLYGKSVYKGIVTGPVFVLKRGGQAVLRRYAESVAKECHRLKIAVKRSEEQLSELCQKALKEAGESGAALFQAHLMLLKDEQYLHEIGQMIEEEKITAEYAVSKAGERFAETFTTLEDEYMRERAADIRELSERIVRNLQGEEQREIVLTEPSVIVADDLSPEETLRLERDKILAFVTAHGSVYSHTAILARIMNIPAVVGVPLDWEKLRTGTRAVVDGLNGAVILEPSEEVCVKTQRRIAEEKEEQELLLKLRGKANRTRDGRKIDLYANIGSVEDIDAVLECDAGGIGLFRSEFLYLGRHTFPTEEEQFQVYRRLAQAMADKKVVIRTLDIGADKQAEYFGLGKEENPAMGYRAIRICLKQPEIFRTQLRALLRAAVFGNLSVLYPMIISVEEMVQIRRMVEDTARELEAAGAAYRIPEQGIMIETPAAVMISDELAELADFFSIGTNDLTQYTLAVDRQNERLADFYNPHHKAVLKMIKITIDNAHKCGKRVGICGELGADLSLTEKWLEMGADELSAAPSVLLKLRKRVREIG